MLTKNQLYYYFLFVCSPIISLIYAIMNPKDRGTFHIICLFSIFVGLTFAFESNETSDVGNYLEYYNFWKLDGSLNYFFKNVYKPEGYQDLYFPLISIFSSIFYLNDFYFLAIIGLVFGIFYSRVYKIVSSDFFYSKNKTLLYYLSFTTLMLVIPIWRGVNGIRFSLAAIYFVYIILTYRNRAWEWRIILYLSLSFFIHFAMIFPISVFLGYFLIKRFISVKLLFLCFILSFLFTSLNLDTLNSFLKNLMPDFLFLKIDAYARESRIEELSNLKVETNWYAKIFLSSLFNGVSIMIVFIFLKYKDLISFNSKMINLLKFSLFFTTLVNLTDFIPSMGRMALISNILVIYLFIYLIVNIKESRKYFSLMNYLLFPFLLIYNIVQIRIGLDYLSVETIIGNPITALFGLEKTPIIDLIK